MPNTHTIAMIAGHTREWRVSSLSAAAARISKLRSWLAMASMSGIKRQTAKKSTMTKL
jgi:hypothetical protein